MKNNYEIDLPNWSLVYALIDNNSIDLLEHYISSQPEMVNTKYKGKTLLHHAVNYDKLDIVKLLVNKGADIQKKSSDGLSIFTTSCLLENNELEFFLASELAKIDEEFRKRDEIFCKLVDSINKRDVQETSNLFKQMNEIKDNEHLEEIFTRHDKDGNTIFHLLATSEDNDLIEAAKSYKFSFWHCLSSKNKNNQTALELLEEVAVSSPEFAKNTKHLLTASYCQEHILKQMRKYLNRQFFAENEYNGFDVKILENSLVEGNCMGFSVLWAESNMTNYSNQFQAFMKKIALWDGDDMSIRIQEAFEYMISAVRFAHVAGLNLEKLEWKKTANKVGYTKEDAPLLNFGQHDLHITMDKEYVQILDHDNYFIIPKNEYAEFIKDLFSNEKYINKTFLITANRHVIAARLLEEGVVEIYDSNDMYDAYTDDVKLSTIFKIADGDFSEVADKILKSLLFSADVEDINLGMSMITNKCDDIAPKLLKKHNYSDILFAIKEDKAEQLENLLKECPDQQKFIKFCKPLEHAANHGSLKALKFLIKNNIGTESDSLGKALISAAYNGNVKIVDCLIKNNADPNYIEGNNLNALRMACQNDNKDMIEHLLKKGADMYQISNDGTTVLDTCLFNETMGLFHLLLDKDESKQKFDLNSGSLLNTACIKGNLEVIRLLINKGVDVNKVMDDESITPISMLCVKGDIKAVKILLDAGADIYKTSCNTNAIIAAFSSKNPDLIYLLLDYTTRKDLDSNINMEVIRHLSQKEGVDVDTILKDIGISARMLEEHGCYDTICAWIENNTSQGDAEEGLLAGETADISNFDCDI